MTGWKRIAVMVAPLLASACAAVPAAVPQRPAPVQQPTAGAYGKPMQLMGMDAKRLIQTFGQPRLDIRERTMRKLQFENSRCVLDAYLYAPAQGKEPVVTHVDTRLPSGLDTEPNACAAALSAR